MLLEVPYTLHYWAATTGGCDVDILIGLRQRVAMMRKALPEQGDGILLKNKVHNSMFRMTFLFFGWQFARAASECRVIGIVLGW